MTVIRLADATRDAVAVTKIYKPYVLNSAISFETVAPSTREMETRISLVLPFAPWLVFERDGEILGYAYASRHRDRAAYQWSVDTAVYIRNTSHRQGIGRALYTSLIGLLRLQGFYAAHAGVTLPNPGSVGLHETMGFRQIGVYPRVGYKNNQWHDVGWWQLPLQECFECPLAPRPTADAQRDSPHWDTILASGMLKRRADETVHSTI
ncbi:MAG: arsinothricin resistance N-acetyltransferase ArsN1 family B [Bdellovibrionales bacterium]